MKLNSEHEQQHVEQLRSPELQIRGAGGSRSFPTVPPVASQTSRGCERPQDLFTPSCRSTLQENIGRSSALTPPPGAALLLPPLKCLIGEGSRKRFLLAAADAEENAVGTEPQRCSSLASPAQVGLGGEPGWRLGWLLRLNQTVVTSPNSSDREHRAKREEALRQRRCSPLWRALASGLLLGNQQTGCCCCLREGGHLSPQPPWLPGGLAGLFPLCFGAF